MGARKKQVVVPSEILTKRQKVDQARAKAEDEQLVIEGEMLMTATEELPWSYDEATTRYSQRYVIDYEETYSTVASLNPIRANLAKNCEDGAIIEQCVVDTAFLYAELDEEIYMELPDGLMEILGDTYGGDEDLVCLLEKGLYGLKQTSRVWNETIDRHLKSMGFKPTNADPCVYARDDNDQRCIVCLYVDDMLIASRDKDVMISVKAQIAENFNIKELGQARYILGIEIDYNMEDKTLGV
ncbi:unnamed protein product [Phytophthora fragariaefolia]|uniref:Unnamed protein product n=1 Tax=Phytophthora fragariaefolia TaxID=1490495 RepID=A0A9W6XG66_9STRA|nr:unnamed protein product [Phytophthora fragariaefolia]